MQMILPPYANYVTDQEIIVEHRGQELRFHTGAFSKKSFAEDKALFKHINGFWQSLPPQSQDEIFNTYIRIFEIFDSSDYTEDIDQLLSYELETLFQYHDFDHIRLWVQTQSDIIFPKPPQLLHTFEETPDQKDKNHTREKTYLISEYIDLVCMIVQLRIMIPIWGKYITRKNKIAGTLFKEFYALHLLDHTPFVHQAPFIKLYTYVRCVLPEKGSRSDILKGISSEEFPLWNLAQLIVRKLCLSDIRGLDPTPILVRHISTHLTEKANRIDTDIDNAIKPKGDKSETGSEENQISVLEQYKIKEETSTGDIQYLLWCVSDPYKVAQTLSPGVDTALVDQALEAMDSLVRNDADPVQTQLLMWLIDPVVPAESVAFMSRLDRARCLCACSAAYWNKGYHLIAAICTASAAADDGSMLISSTDSKSRLAKEVQDRLSDLYPYGRRQKGTKFIKEEIQAIDNMLKALTSRTWLSNMHPWQMKILNPQFPQMKRLSIPHNFRETIADLVIEIATRVPTKQAVTV